MKLQKSNQILPIRIKFLAVIYFLLLFSAAKAQKNIDIDTINKPSSIKLHYYFEKKASTVDDYSKIDTTKFKANFEKRPGYGVPFWSTFYIHLREGVTLKYLEFNFPTVDEGVVYVPILRGSHKQYTIGLSHPREKVPSLKQTSAIVIDAKDIDFSRPFFFENTPLFIFGFNSFSQEVYITGYDKKPKTNYTEYEQQQLKQANIDFEYNVLSGMLFISFVFVLVFYSIHRKRYFFSYAFYLLSLNILYSSWVPYFYNIYSSLDNYLYLYIGGNMQTFATFFYMLFMKQFVEMKQNYPKLNRIYWVFLYWYIPFIIVANVLVFLNPRHPNLDKLTEPIVYIVSITCFVIVGYMLIKRRTIRTLIVFVSCSLVVIVRSFAIAIPEINSELSLMYVITIETILFMVVISSLDKKNIKKAAESDKLKQINNFKNRFIANISHEFRTPLTLISAPIAMKLEGKTLSEEDHSDFEMIQRNNKRLLNLVDQLLDLSKIESGGLKLQIKQGNVLELIVTLTEPFAYKAKQKSLIYQVRINEDTYGTWFDRDVIEKITFNLLSNAFKYTPKAGTIECIAFVENNILTIEVKNTGKGLSKEQMKKVFERFYQVDENQQGTGIGLALVKELVTLHKGVVNVESKLNDWTTFRASLPVDKKSFNASGLAIVTNVEKTNPGTMYHDMEDMDEMVQNMEDELPILLIVEDSVDLGRLLKNIFKEEYNVIIAKNGQEGVKLALKHIPDLIISDIMMPVKDGIALTKDLKNDERTSHIPIILLTAKVGEKHELTGIETGADAYVIKPFSSKILISKVKNLIEIRQKLRDKYSQELVLKPKEITITPIDEQFLTRVQGVLDKNLIEPSFNAEKFSQMIGMSRMQLHRKLKALTELSTSEFIKSQRLKLAAQLLKDPNIRVSDVGYTVGFNSISYFSSCFKEMFHCTPSEYIKR